VPWQESTFPGVLGNVVAGRIANRFDLHGTNVTVDAACASSLAAVARAVQDLAATAWPSPCPDPGVQRRGSGGAAHPDTVELRNLHLHLPRGRGLFYGYLLPIIDRIPAIGHQFLPIMRARFRPHPAVCTR